MLTSRSQYRRDLTIVSNLNTIVITDGSRGGVFSWTFLFDLFFFLVYTIGSPALTL